MPAPSRFDHVSVTKSNSTRSIATHPCKGRKDGAPPVGMVHAKIVTRRGHPPSKLLDERKQLLTNVTVVSRRFGAEML